MSCGLDPANVMAGHLPVRLASDDSRHWDGLGVNKRPAIRLPHPRPPCTAVGRPTAHRLRRPIPPPQVECGAVSALEGTAGSANGRRPRGARSQRPRRRFHRRSYRNRSDRRRRQIAQPPSRHENDHDSAAARLPPHALEDQTPRRQQLCRRSRAQEPRILCGRPPHCRFAGWGWATAGFPAPELANPVPARPCDFPGATIAGTAIALLTGVSRLDS